MCIIKFLFPSLNVKNNDRPQKMSLNLKIFTIIYIILQALEYARRTGSGIYTFVVIVVAAYILCVEFPIVAWFIGKITRHNLTFWEIANCLWLIIIVHRCFAFITTTFYAMHIVMKTLNALNLIWFLVNSYIILRKALNFTRIQSIIVEIIYILATYIFFIYSIIV